MSLKDADIPIREVVGFFASFGLEAGLLVPTATGLEKSIMDAHASLREYLAARSTHDYNAQGKGGDNKVMLRAWLVGTGSMIETKASLYRPETKNGDPRIWFGNLGKYAVPGNVLAVLSDARDFFVVNASAPGLLDSGRVDGSPLATLLERLAPKEGEAIAELIERLRGISRRGFLPSMRRKATGVGYTLETLLGINANSGRAPDYKGIELKSTRVGEDGASLTRLTILSKTPDWKMSAVKTAKELVERYGYVEDKEGRRQLYCSMNHKPNTLGLFLDVDDGADVLHSFHQRPKSEARAEKVVQWAMPVVRERLREKHPETCVVKARTRRPDGGGEEFHYVSARYTRNPLSANLATLLDTGVVEVDFLVHLRKSKAGKLVARDHGYLFKIREKDHHLLFGPSKEYALA